MTFNKPCLVMFKRAFQVCQRTVAPLSWLGAAKNKVRAQRWCAHRLSNYWRRTVRCGVGAWHDVASRSGLGNTATGSFLRTLQQVLPPNSFRQTRHGPFRSTGENGDAGGADWWHSRRDGWYRHRMRQHFRRFRRRLHGMSLRRHLPAASEFASGMGRPGSLDRLSRSSLGPDAGRAWSNGRNDWRRFGLLLNTSPALAPA
jgi:hypothetical protein